MTYEQRKKERDDDNGACFPKMLHGEMFTSCTIKESRKGGRVETSHDHHQGKITKMEDDKRDGGKRNNGVGGEGGTNKLERDHQTQNLSLFRWVVTTSISSSPFPFP